MRNMSFSMTTEQMKNRSKTVTRRFGWWFSKPSDIVMAVEKGMGLKKGEKIKPLYPIEILNCRGELLHEITKADCIKEGFPDYEPEEYILMMCEKFGCSRYIKLNRIEFREVKDGH